MNVQQKQRRTECMYDVSKGMSKEISVLRCETNSTMN